jgi:hypothetical protein
MAECLHFNRDPINLVFSGRNLEENLPRCLLVLAFFVGQFRPTAAVRQAPVA